MNHTQHLHRLIKEREYNSYLEIGYGTGENFQAIDLEKKTAVDPHLTTTLKDAHEMRSDDYFDRLDGRTKFDVIFIDGDHTADQVERDIVNAWKHLKKGGVLVIHDIAPANEEMTRVPRETKQWTGNVFQAWAGLVDAYPDLKWTATEEDHGIATIEYDKDIKIEPGFVSSITFDEYAEQKDKYFKA